MDPGDCLDKREDGCVAAVLLSINPSGIRAAGAIASFEFGPVTVDDLHIDVFLSLLEQYFLLSGGVTIENLGSAELFVSVGGLPVPHAEFYGHLAILPDSSGTHALEALVEAKAKLLGDEPGDPPFDISPELLVRAWMTADFNRLLGLPTGEEFAKVAESVREIRNAYNRYKADPVAGLRDAVAFLEGEGVAIPEWVDDMLDYLDTVADKLETGVPMPSLSKLLSGGTYTISLPAIPWCLPQGYNSTTGKCSGGGDPIWLCNPLPWPGSTRQGNQCVYTISLPSLPSSIVNLGEDFDNLAAGFAAEIEQLFVTAIQTVDYLVDTGLANVEAYYLALAQAPPRISLLCAEFRFEMSAASSKVAMALRMRAYGNTLNLGLEIDLNDPLASVGKLVTDVINHLVKGEDLPAPTATCDGPPKPPAGVTSVTFPALDLSLANDDIDEGSTARLTGTFTGPVPRATTVTIDWGDGSNPSTVSVAEGAASFGPITHRYRDDDPTGVADADYEIIATVEGETTPQATAPITVRNVAPTVAVVMTDDDPNLAFRIDEGGVAELTFTITDPGPDDTHTAVIDWGDGTVTQLPSQIFGGLGIPGGAFGRLAPKVNLAGEPITLTHVYADDRPKWTPGDPVDVTITVTDDDTGETTTTVTGWIDNVEPSLSADALDAISRTVVKEGDEVTFTIEFEDPGVLDTHFVWVDWGDDTDPDMTIVAPDPERASDETITVEMAHTYLDDAPPGTPQDPYTMTIFVGDDDTGQTSTSVDVIVHNVVPDDLELSVEPTEIDELGTVQLSGTFEDPGVLDWFCVDIDWGHDALDPTVLELPVGARDFEASKQYGDRGEYTITATLWDKDRPVADGADPELACSERDDPDLDHAVVDTVEVTVHNVDPTVTIDDGDAVIPPSGIPTIIVRAGDELAMEATAEDPGSDDLTFVWDWDDGTITDAGTSFRSDDGTPDPFPSPDVAPRMGEDAATMAASHIYEEPCLYEVTVTVVDDDGGEGQATIPVVVTGTDDRVRTAGYWYTQMRRPDHNSQSLTHDELTCRLAIARHMSSVFDDLRDASTLGKATDVLNTRQTSSEEELMERQLLALWLNFAHGSVTWDQMVDTTGDAIADTTLRDLFFEAEAVRHDPQATREEFLEQKDRLEQVNIS